LQERQVSQLSASDSSAAKEELQVLQRDVARLRDVEKDLRAQLAGKERELAEQSRLRARVLCCLLSARVSLFLSIVFEPC
jgi:hypothetical protein